MVLYKAAGYLPVIPSDRGVTVNLTHQIHSLSLNIPLSSGSNFVAGTVENIERPLAPEQVEYK